MMPEQAIKAHYEKEVVPVLMKEFNITNRLRVPRLIKVVVNTGLKQAVTDSKVVGMAVQDIATITGQKPTVTKAKKAISNFKLREGMPIGARVTLRSRRMYDFVNRLFNLAFPRVRDFKGLSPKAFDGKGNYTAGLTEQGIFPEIDLDRADNVFGMNVTFVTSAETDAEGRRLLELMGMPFRK